MQRAWLREFNGVGLQLRPAAAKLVTQFLTTCDDPTSVAEALVAHTKTYTRQLSGVTAAFIDQDVIQAVISTMLEASKESAGGGLVQEADVKQSIQVGDLGDGTYVYNVLKDVKPCDYDRSSKAWVLSSKRPKLFPGCDVKSKIYADRYFILLQRLLLENRLVTEAEAAAIGVMPNQRVLTPVESLVGNPGRKLTFGLMSRVQDDKSRTWVIEDLNKVYPVELEVDTTHHLMTDGSFVLAEGEVVGDKFRIQSLQVPDAVSRAVSLEKDLIPRQGFGGDISEEQLDLLATHESSPENDGMFVILCEVHLDNPRVIEKLSDVFQGYEESSPPAAYIFMGSFCSSSFVPSADGVRLYKDGFERLKFMMKSLPNHVQNGTRFVFIPGPQDPGAQTLPRMPLTNFYTSDLAKDIPNVIMASNPCRVRHFSRELVFFRHDVLRLLRRHEMLPLRDPQTGGAPSPQYLREEMIRFLADQAHLVPLPLEESNILWAYDFALRLYPLPHAAFIGGISEAFDCKHLDSTFCSVGPFFRDASFYAYYPIKDMLEPCDIPDRGA
ncbi:unnamed protein product [Prorocentrum cordatum]|uniref:DNA polymerase II subunit 2 n=1 Tax=Prorocentrum cordatum TaxID=2364126 RepID=A0ABN9SWB8_9DINO|nr:unnamed protein product [Polarella glacialis]|mmetsp:Transcript_109894/g.311679  ORF Transcript_109894/g.311679 Transcript_109894/m.311679 type:complete len:553 (+) Transcript_109894:114-1772(+)